MWNARKLIEVKQQFKGELPAGDWTLTIQDSSPADVGTVDFWQVYVTPY